MIYYILSFICCLLIDYLEDKPFKIIRFLLIAWIFAFLCFGYMTGSDWRVYELVFNDDINISRYSVNEFLFAKFITIARYVISDFWVFNGLCKVFFLLTFIKLVCLFTDRVWTTVGVAFVFNLLFITIDCPMRFMLALSFVQLAAFYFINNKIIIGGIFSFISVFFHLSGFIVLIILLSYRFLRIIIKLNSKVLLFLFIIILIIPSIPSVFTVIYSVLSSIPVFDRYADVYGNFQVQTYTTLGFWKNFILGIILILSKEQILHFKYGEQVFYYSYLFFILSAFLSCIPVGFRLNIINGFFVTIAFVNLVLSPDFFPSMRLMIKGGAVAFVVLLLAQNVYGDWKYLPYSNSIPYIISGHLPYDYRDLHNLPNY